MKFLLVVGKPYVGCKSESDFLLRFRVDPNFVTESGELRQSPFEMAAEKHPELSQFLKLQLTRTKLSLLMSQEDDSEKAKVEFAELLKTIPPAEVTLSYDFYLQLFWPA